MGAEGYDRLTLTQDAGKGTAVYRPGTLTVGVVDAPPLRMTLAEYEAMPRYAQSSNYGESWRTTDKDGARLIGEYVRGGIDYFEVEITD